jgi:ribosomal protein S27AE
LNDSAIEVEELSSSDFASGGRLVLTKAWQCPHCGREFIVARDAERDTCPWCKTTVQEKAGNLEKAQAAPPPPTPPSPSAAGPTPGGQAGMQPPPTAPHHTVNRPTGEMWWPYEYDPF